MRLSAFPLALCAALGLASTVTPASAAEKYSGFLCCNLRTDGSWASDNNYAENGKRILPAGTPVEVTGYGRFRTNIRVNGEKQSIGNDYSRDLDDAAFTKRWVVTEDPNLKIAGYPEKIKKAISNAQVAKGMTREQVLMALGYPMSSENPNLDAKVWRYWRGSFSEFQVQFAGDKVSDITTDPQTKNLVWAD